MNDFYKIETNDKYFRIRQSDNSFSLLELERSKVIDVKQSGFLIVAKKGKDLYDLYLPSNCTSSLSRPLLSYHQLYLVLSDVSDYLVYENLLVFKQSESCYKFLYIPNFIIALAEYYLLKRFEQLPSISCNAGDSYGIRSGFDAISSINKDYSVRFFVFRLGNKDYLISIDIHDVVPLYDSGIKITALGTATSLQWNGLFFKSADDNGNEYWHEYPLFIKEGPYAKIEEIRKEDYPSIYRPETFTGYLKKDKDGFILGVTFVLKATPIFYSIRLESLAKELTFVRTFEEKSLSDNQEFDSPTELWKIKTTQDETTWLLVSRKFHSYTMIPNEIFLEK